MSELKSMIAEDILRNERPFLNRLECDGATRVLHYSLTKARISHRCFYGRVFLNEENCIPHHFWISLDDGRLIDCKARMWAGQNAPDGIFKPREYPEYKYHEVQQLELKVDVLLYKALRENSF